MSTQPHALTTLSFAGSTGKGGAVNLWMPYQATNSAEANAEGRRRAGELAYFMEQQDLPFLLGHVIAAMIQNGEYGPLETGFCQAIAEMALSADIPAVQPVAAAGRPVLRLVDGGVS